MAITKLSFTFTYSLLLTLLFFHAVLARSHNQTKSSFEFLNHLQGCHKGDRTKGVCELKHYLEKFGYLNYNQSSDRIHADDDNFDDALESAVKTYQFNYHLNVRGNLDSQMVSKMMMPCGVANIINGTTRMGSGKKGRNLRGLGSFHPVSRYTFMNGNPRWPASKYRLTYGFAPGTPTAAKEIGFERGDHGDGTINSFDGPGGTIAHAFRPTIGLFHYDAGERWAVGPAAGSQDIDLETVALHEIGHLLGLGHSDVEGAIMFSSISPGTTKGLREDDIQGIRALYNF
ncbi:hypothetical protein NL676_003313 [Syzygium grande]|nr:hypothetical protein NL676_003313 [Syzygium grande]